MKTIEDKLKKEFSYTPKLQILVGKDLYLKYRDKMTREQKLHFCEEVKRLLENA